MLLEWPESCGVSKRSTIPAKIKNYSYSKKISRLRRNCSSLELANDLDSNDWLDDEKKIAFNAGTYSQLVKLACEDYEKLVNPKIISL
ncbi:hypothetical protein [Coxiella-like endosymbiont]|uniref:hypothetical protein n=1 Tax=Coxiella-like endosymbiont TaxID=1592897 RepID=UPI0027299343|nr:hypothetical protein [Coxiella-like endosymbiont]